MPKGDPNKIQKFRNEFCSFVLDRLRRGYPASEIREALDALVPRMFTTYGSDYERRTGIHPSEVEGCALRLYHSAIGTEYRNPPGFEPRMDIGSAIHDIVQNAFEGLEIAAEGSGKYGVLIEPAIDNTAYARKYGLVGNTDMVFCLDDKPLLVTEIKSGLVPKEPYMRHRYQGVIYQMCFKAPYLWYYYTNRDGDQWNNPLYGRPDKKMVAEIRTKLKAVLTMVEKGTPPYGEPDYMSCTKACGYYYLCRPKF